VLTLSGLQHMAADKSITITMDIPETLEALGDLEMVKTIVRNLVSNAIKFSPEGTQIRVEGRGSGGVASIAVRDQGIGMSPAAMARLFKIGPPNVSKAGTRGERGTGLGLILCKELATKNHGDIQVESTLGKGSVFTLILPAPASLGPAS
ncbi:MAG TPA: HAMP domain-containing sensor histidine kinase, partial [bacterium]|nr:HAMP domain-containing sensor histidine kinase [bacterium]